MSFETQTQILMETEKIRVNHNSLKNIMKFLYLRLIAIYLLQKDGDLRRCIYIIIKSIYLIEDIHC